MSKASERQAWTKFVEGHAREAKRPRAKKRVKEQASQAELEAGLDDLVADVEQGSEDYTLWPGSDKRNNGLSGGPNIGANARKKTGSSV